MPLLIDGYNLVHVAGILGQGVGPGSLQRSRLALLNFLAESLTPGELPHTTVVFDSHNALGVCRGWWNIVASPFDSPRSTRRPTS